MRMAENQRQQAAVPHLQGHVLAESWLVTWAQNILLAGIITVNIASL